MHVPAGRGHLATFSGDTLAECHAIVVALSIRPASTPPATTPPAPGLAWLSGSARRCVGRWGRIFLALLTGPLEPPGPAKATEARAQLEKLRAAEWPPAGLRDRAKRGELARVATCGFANRPALGSCKVEGLARSASGHAAMTWGVTRYHFRASATHGTDAALKACVKVGGAWKAAPVGVVVTPPAPVP